MTAGVWRFAFAEREPGIIAAVSLRDGGVSDGPYASLNVGGHVGDAPAAVAENRRRVCDAIGVDLDRLTIARQVHGRDVVVVGEPDVGRGGADDAQAVGPADGLVTAVPGAAIAILSADCVPVVVVDPITPAIGVAHAGWRGTVAGVARAVVEAMVGAYGSRPAELCAGIGPSIGPASYQVGPDVADAARDAFPEVDVVVSHPVAGVAFDLWTANRHWLVTAGLSGDRIEVAGIDTFSDDRFFSDRRVRPCGRFMTVAALGG